MPDAVVTALAFFAGLVVAIRLLAALYGPIDLWYTIRTAWPVVLRRIVLWAAVTAAVLWLGGEWRRAFLVGMAVHLLVHVASWLLVTHGFPRNLKPTNVAD